jgi:hypothetical protein
MSADRCDDGNQQKCDGCENGRKRRWIRLDSAKAKLSIPGGPPATTGVCLEAWIRMSSGNPFTLEGSFSLQFFGAVTNSDSWWVYTDSINDQISHTCDSAGTYSWDDGQWHHLALCAQVEYDHYDTWNDITVYGFRDGKPCPELYKRRADLGAVPCNPPLLNVMFTGRDLWSEGFTGYIDEIRISKGLRYPYNKQFEPKRRHKYDSNTVALFHCDTGKLADPMSKLSFNVSGKMTSEADTGYKPSFCK